MFTLTLKPIARTYSNNGQHAEQVLRYTLTNEITKADNKPHTDGADVGDIQIKSARATVCNGLDINKYLETDKAKRFAYIIKDFTLAYIMSKKEYIEFVNEFGTVTRDSKANGGKKKIRLKSESKKMIEWLTRNA